MSDRKMTQEEYKNDFSVQKDDLSHLSTVSSKIRFLSAQGKKRSEIAKILNIRYQHVRNVLVTPLKKN